MKKIFFETKILFETPNFEQDRLIAINTSKKKDKPTEDTKSPSPSTKPEKKKEAPKESPTKELNRQERRLFQLLNDIQRPVEGINDEKTKQEVNEIIEDFKKAIIQKDYELAKNYLELLEDTLASSSEEIVSYARAETKINHARDVGLFETTGINIITKNTDSSIPERQFKIQETDSNVFPGGIYTTTSELNELLFKNGLTEENLRNTYLKIAEKEITKLFERSENNLPAEDKELLLACMNSNTLITPGIKFTSIDSDKLDRDLEENIDGLLEEYYETNKKKLIEIDEEEFTSGNYIEIPYPRFPVSVPNEQIRRNETPQVIPEPSITSTEKEIRIQKHSEEIPNEVIQRLKDELTERYKDLPLNIRSETINKKLDQILRYYKRKIAKKHIEYRLGKKHEGIVIY